MTVLSHYTSRAGFEGIIQSKTLWATNFLDLNDSTEFFYAWKILHREALEKALAKIPAENLLPNIDLDAHTETAIQQFKALFPPDRGLMYVVSFATSSVPDHELRGIRTIWELYTKHEGYCLQFAEEDVRRLLDGEMMKGSYAALSLEKVKYGVDRKSDDYLELCYQLEQFYLRDVLRARPDLRIDVDFQEMWADSHFQRKLMEFCARHKDPCFEDEREMRIFAFPADQAMARAFYGLAAVKQRRQSPAGKSYISIGEFWNPTLTPKRIIIGTRANRDITTALSYCDPKPEVAYANLPVA